MEKKFKKNNKLLSGGLFGLGSKSNNKKISTNKPKSSIFGSMMKMGSKSETIKNTTSNPGSMKNMMKKMTSNPGSMKNMMKKMTSNPGSMKNMMKKMTSSQGSMQNMMKKMTSSQGSMQNMKEMTPNQGSVQNMKEMTPNQGSVQNMKEMTPNKGSIQNMKEMTPNQGSMQNTTTGSNVIQNIIKIAPNELSNKKTIKNMSPENIKIEVEKLIENKKKIINNELNLIEEKKKLLEEKKLLINKNSKIIYGTEINTSQTGGTLNNEIESIKEKSVSEISNFFEKKKKIINNETTNIDQKIDNLKEKSSHINEQLDLLTSELIKKQMKDDSIVDNLKGGIQTNDDKVEIKDKRTFMQKIKSFFRSDFFAFMKYYLYFIILFIIIFYITIRINSNTKNSMIIIETKIFFYISIIVLFIIINDILETPLESIQKFLYVLLFTLVLLYIVTYLVQHYYKKSGFFDKLKIILLCAFIIFVIMVIYIYFNFQSKDKNVATDLFNSFNYGITKNIFFSTFLFFYLLVYYLVFYLLDWNSSLTDMLEPFILGVMLVFFIFCLIIYIALKMKIINRIKILNTFIALFAIFIFLIFICTYIFMSSLGTICTTNETAQSLHEQEIVSLIIIASIFTILWLDDSRNWRQIGSIFFVIATIITLYCMFYYSVAHPSTGMLSFWLFIEWLIIIFYRKENSKNSIHYSFMKT